MDILNDFLATFEKAKEFDDKLCFIISKSDNKNFVAYSCELTDGNFSLPKPVKKYWQTWEEKVDGKPLPTHTLSHLEKKLAYGTQYLSVSEQLVNLTINAYKSLPISLKVKNNQVITELEFSGMKYHLLGIYAHIEGTITPKMRPKGISLVVKLPISEPDAEEIELSPAFTIYIDGKTKVD